MPLCASWSSSRLAGRRDSCRIRSACCFGRCIRRNSPQQRQAESADDDVAIGEALEQAGEAEVVCIIRPVNQPGAASRVVILNRASRRFVEYLADELDDRPEILETTLKAPDEKPRARKLGATQKVKRPAALPADASAAIDATESQPRGPQAYRRSRTR